jgi:ribonuclease HI
MTIYAACDGASRGNPGESGIGIIFRDDQGKVIFSAGGYIGSATNNIAEYEALLACITKARALKCAKLVVRSDSQLMVRQIQGTYRVKDAKLKKYFQRVKELMQSSAFEFEIIHVDREDNREADMLANAGIDSKQTLSI